MRQISLAGIRRLFSGLFSRQKQAAGQGSVQDLLPVSEPGVFVPGHRQAGNEPEDGKNVRGDVEPISEPGVLVVGAECAGLQSYLASIHRDFDQACQILDRFNSSHDEDRPVDTRHVPPRVSEAEQYIAEVLAHLEKQRTRNFAHNYANLPRLSRLVVSLSQKVQIMFAPFCKALRALGIPRGGSPLTGVVLTLA